MGAAASVDKSALSDARPSDINSFINDLPPNVLAAISLSIQEDPSTKWNPVYWNLL